VSEEEYLRLIKDAGFEDVKVVDRSDIRKTEEPGSLKVSSIRVGAVRPAGQMKALSDRLLGTHLAGAGETETVCCPPAIGDYSAGSADAGAKAEAGGCGCS